MSPESKARIAAMRERQAQKPHGTRSRYTAGRCRCDDCKAANTAHEHYRAKQRIFHGKNPFVSPQPAREHLLWLGIAEAARLRGLSEGEAE